MTAYCAQSQHGDLWFNYRAEDVVKPICNLCPERDPCLERALTLETGIPMADVLGVWGGLGPSDRLPLLGWPV